MGRSSAYWTSNLYANPEEEPERAAPLRDLPGGGRLAISRAPGWAAADPRRGRTGPVHGSDLAVGLGIRNREIASCAGCTSCAPVSTPPSLSPRTKKAASAKGAKVAGALGRAIVEGQRTGPVKWCWLELVDRRSVDAFLSLARRKAEWLAERTPPRRAPRPPSGNAGSDEIETD